MRLPTIALFLSGSLLSAARAAEPLVVDVWPGKPAGDDAAAIGAEKWLGPLPGEEEKYKRRLTNVTRPTLTIYRPPREKQNGAAVVICPGGGYHSLAWDFEGVEAAQWLNSLGMTGMILKYRCPRRPGEKKEIPAPGPLKDAQRAISLVRSKAAEWHIDPRRIGMIGFSAGGHLVAATATNFSQRSYPPSDEIDRVSCRPDFGIMAYSGYLYELDRGRLSPTLRIGGDVPPLFLVHTSDDPGPRSQSDNDIMFYLALKRAGVSCELHIYASGGHGFGVRQDGPCGEWTKTCARWLQQRGILRPK
jgi:acetyl esterase/lipase